MASASRRSIATSCPDPDVLSPALRGQFPGEKAEPHPPASPLLVALGDAAGGGRPWGERRTAPSCGASATVFDGGSVAGLADGPLLERFARRGDDDSGTSAFAVLVERHGPMVCRVCRATLRDEHEAEDAFQAVFLVLARKARSLWVRDSLGPWLHAVALRTAAVRPVRGEAPPRPRTPAGRVDRPSTSTNRRDDDPSPVIHEELGKLPDRYRRPWSSATSKGSPTRRPPAGSAGRSGRSRAASPAAGTGSASD